MKFNEVLNKYIELIGCSSKLLAENSGLSDSIICRYRNGNRIPNENNLKKISLALEKISNQKYEHKKILEDFYKSENIYDIDFSIIKNNLNKLINELSINVSEMAKYLNFDASYLSRIRKGERVPSNKEEFVNSLATFIYKKYYVNNQNKVLLSSITNSENKNITIDTLKKWLTNNSNKENGSVEIDDFLKKLDEFDLNDYIKVINFDKLKIPTIPFYKCKNKNYYGIEEMKQGELDFFKTTVLSKNKNDIYMCSDMPMEDMAKDIEFGKKWMFAIAASIKKGLHLNIIHNLDRPFNEMMLGLESWIPIYMTGQVSPFYLKNTTNAVYQHLNYVSGVAALTGECISGHHDSGKYYITSKDEEIKYYQKKITNLFKIASPLMEIYRKEKSSEYKKFHSNQNQIETNRERILSSLPLFTINDDILITILKNNNINDEDIKLILDYRKEEEKATNSVLEKNTITDIIPKINKEYFQNNELYLNLNDIFYDKKIKYDYNSFTQHLNLTKEYAKKQKNYILKINNQETFKNINITILKDTLVIITKSNDPVIQFVIKHPKLVHAIENFSPLVKE